ncbi:imidazoleglycerol-phosphate dehydratase HisB [Desulfocurvibacter africanus]|uniref:Imidazoleglycerol-phosphate dehydratase n=1 Tax=Desulfocurvibacter africanus subsp. africanus str. Walvis Bay TaxID=690850 RepID=F3Z3R0_DESAF|nr:imidazoleglycerol-phosphate dehydratase HisB [Desulfocurvibacter africanus]EGJ51525.1 Imidazoleglycerol-phosphate dehydratase [Desulfocurvibacter africanus subsp. africanus str. Walvis Bay]
MNPRNAAVSRETRETCINVRLDLDGTGKTEVSTGFGFADHMLTLMAFWAGFDLNLSCRGDLHIDAHHTLEDVGLCLGQCLAEALGDRAGIERVGWAKVPMDEALAEAVVDLSGRAWLVYRENAALPPVIAGEEKDIWREFFKSFAAKAGMNLHVTLEYGQNGHHLLEAAFKALGLSLRRAVSRGRSGVPSTKGALDA